MKGIFEKVILDNGDVLHKDIDIVMKVNDEEQILSIKKLKLVKGELMIDAADNENLFNDYFIYGVGYEYGMEQKKRIANEDGKNFRYSFSEAEYIANGKNLYKTYFRLKADIGQLFTDNSEQGMVQHRPYGIISNYCVEKIRQAYIDSCNKTGLAFHRSKIGYIEGPELNDKLGITMPDDEDWRLIGAYEGSGLECDVNEEACDILKENGLKYLDKIAHTYSDNSGYIATEAGLISLLMQFIGLSMPEDFRWKFSSFPSIDLYENILPEGCEFGYELFRFW